MNITSVIGDGWDLTQLVNLEHRLRFFLNEVEMVVATLDGI